MKEFFNKVWLKLNGNKTLIGSVSMVVLQSTYAESMIEPNLLSLLYNIAIVIFGGGLGHKIVKGFKK